MKTYSVMCMGAPDDFSSMCSVEVKALDVDGAKREAVKLMAKMGYPDATVLPDLPGMSAVLEL